VCLRKEVNYGKKGRIKMMIKTKWQCNACAGGMPPCKLKFVSENHHKPNRCVLSNREPKWRLIKSKEF
jgi:hypothetical protein